MARDLDLPVRVVAVPTVREADGLALSSRNRGLTPDQRRVAARLYETLTALAARLAGGAAVAPEVARGRDQLARAGFERVDYLELRDGETLAMLDRAAPGARLFAAAELGDIRLIDNLSVD